MSKKTCKGCRHFYTVTVGADGVGYNPAPCCHLLEDAGNHPDILLKTCFSKRGLLTKSSQKTNTVSKIEAYN